MAPDGERRTRQASAPDDWAAKAAERVESFVDLLRDKSVRPVLRAVQFLVFGLAGTFLLLVIVVLVAIAVIRVLDVFVFAGRVWASYTLTGGIFFLAGVFLLSRRHGSRTGAST